MDQSIINNGSDPLAFEGKNERDDDHFVDLTVRNFNYSSIDRDDSQHFPYKNPNFKMKTGYQSKNKNFGPKKNSGFFKKKEIHSEPEILSTTPEMNELNIPPFLQHSYINGIPEPKITQLRDWQKQLFQRPEWLFSNSSDQSSLDSSQFTDMKSKFNMSNIGASAIVLVPTSGGKTVAADVAISQLLASDPDAKAIYALPFVALANEKYSEFTKRFYKFSVRAYYQNVGGADFRRGNIAVCTYEKAHSLINSALIGKYANKIKLVIIDEIHMIGEEHRGAVIEALIVKLLLMQHQPRIIGLTATININDAHLLAEWIRGFAFISETRPSRVKLFVAKSNGDLHVINKDGTMNQKITTLVKVGGNDFVGSNQSTEMFYILDPIRRLLSKSPDSTVLVFVNRRADTVLVGDFISKYLYDSKIKNLPSLQQAGDELLGKRRTLVQDLSRVTGFVDDPLKRCIINGIGIHHAGLLLEERKLIEAATRNKTLSVIVATTTLSAGINIHSVARVFIMNVFRWSPQNGQIPIPNTQFIQMVGRAGRTAHRMGEAFVFAHSSMEYERKTIENLSKQEIGNIIPHLKDEGELERFFLQCLSTKLLDPIDGLNVFLQTAFNPPQTRIKTASSQPSLSIKKVNEINTEQDKNGEINIKSCDSEINTENGVDIFNSNISDSSIENDELLIEREKIRDRLVMKKLISDTTFMPTALGRAIAGSSLTIEEGLSLYETIQKIQLDLCLIDDIHLLYLCVSPQIASLIQPVAYNNVRWEYIFKHHNHVIKLITGMNDKQIEKMPDYPNIYGGLGRVDKKIDSDLDRIYASVILRELINESPVSEITRKFKIERGTVQSLQMQSATFAGQTSKFCEIIGSGLLATTLNRFRQRLNFAARTELLGLMVVPSITKEVARRLADVGITSPLDLADLTVERIAALLVYRNSDYDQFSQKSAAPTEVELNLAEKILKDSKEYEESFTKLEILEETAIANLNE